MKSINLYVPNMSCASCVAKIESAFSKVNLKGGNGNAISARVNLADKQVQVFGDITPETAIELIKGVGYDSEQMLDARKGAAKKEADEVKEYRTRVIQASIGLGLGVPLMLWGLLGGEMMVNNANQQLAWGVVGLVTFIVMATTGRHFFQGMLRAIKGP